MAESSCVHDYQFHPQSEDFGVCSKCGDDIDWEAYAEAEAKEPCRELGCPCDRNPDYAHQPSEFLPRDRVAEVRCCWCASTQPTVKAARDAGWLQDALHWKHGTNGPWATRFGGRGGFLCGACQEEEEIASADR